MLSIIAIPLHFSLQHAHGSDCDTRLQFNHNAIQTIVILTYSHTGISIDDIQKGPEINEPPYSESPMIASPLNLTCNAEGSPAPSYTWYKDGVLIPAQTRSYLYISEAQPEDRGSYTCRAVNFLGEDYSAPASVTIPGIIVINDFTMYHSDQ